MNLDKKPFSSKKFISYLFSIVVLASILTIALFTQSFGWAMVTFMTIGIITIGALSIGYVLSQAALDKFLSSVTDIMTKKKDEE